MQQNVNTFSRSQLLLIGLAIILAATLRLAWNNQPFPTSDHAQLASVVTFFYPRNVQALIPSATSSWNMLTNAHGILPSIIGITSMTIVGIAGIHITEFWWNLPFVLFNLLPIPLAAVIVARVYNRNAGILAAFLVAIMPLHTSLSRASGLNIPVTLDCHFLTVLSFIHYFQNPTKRNARWASLALTLNLTVEVLFPILFVMVFMLGVWTVKPARPLLLLRIHRTRKLMFSKEVMLLPLIIVCLNFFLLIVYIQGWVSYGGVAARLLEGSNRQPGLYPGDFWDNATYAVGTIAFPLLLILGAFNLPALWRFELRAVPLVWSIVYLLPFLIFTRPHVYEYFLFGTIPLTLNTAIVLHNWFQQEGWQRWLAMATVPLLAVLFVLRMLSMIVGLNLVPIVGTGQAPGGIFPDQGLKATAWWVRNHAEPDDRVFVDSAFEQYQIWYYVRRPFIGVTDAEHAEEAYLLLDEEPSPPAYFLVKPENKDLLRKHTETMPNLLAKVMVDWQQQPALLIYGHQEGNVETIEASSANQRFDEQFGTWKAMFALGTRQ